MNNNSNGLTYWLHDIAHALEHNDGLNAEHYEHFIKEPGLSVHLVDEIDALNESDSEQEHSYFSACIIALEICIAQFKAASDANNKAASRQLNDLMKHMADVMANGEHSLSFWLPVLNAFYEVHVELNDELKNAYFNLVDYDDEPSIDDESSHLKAIRDMLNELSDLSDFDIAENFFSQSYAMPSDFFAELVVDLYSIDEGRDIALLCLLHPKADVREVVVNALDYIMEDITLSAMSLSRLKAIKAWYPKHYHKYFDRWLKEQRKKGVLYEAVSQKSTRIKMSASEVDGSGAQGLFIHLMSNKNNQLCGLLLKQHIGIKDAWITPKISAKDVTQYYENTFDESITLRSVDRKYVEELTNHFLALTIEEGNIPNLHLLDIQEKLGCRFIPQKIDVVETLERIAVQIIPFTPERVEEAIVRSKHWSKTKHFTESWFVENAEVDRLVNKHCNYIDGVKVCQFEDAMQEVFERELNVHKNDWIMHFLWTALWLKSKARKNERLWQDCLLIAYSIYKGRSLDDIPIMKAICHQSVVNSIETMHERRTHLA